MPSVCVEDGLSLTIHRMVAKEFAKGSTHIWNGTWAWWRNGE